MSLAASRAVLRHTTFAARRAGIRNASSTSEATAAAKQKTSDAAASAKDKASDAAAAAKQRAAEFQSKASEGLSRVSSSAGAALSKAGSALGNSAEALSKAGGRTGQVAGTVQSLIPQTVYYSKVGLELGKLVAKERQIVLPDIATFQGYVQPAINAVRQPTTLFSKLANSPYAQPTEALNTLRNISGPQLLATGVLVAEVIGFFTIGEIIGRFKLVGYRSSAPADH